LKCTDPSKREEGHCQLCKPNHSSWTQNHCLRQQHRGDQ